MSLKNKNCYLLSGGGQLFNYHRNTNSPSYKRKISKGTPGPKSRGNISKGTSGPKSRLLPKGTFSPKSRLLQTFVKVHLANEARKRNNLQNEVNAILNGQNVKYKNYFASTSFYGNI